MLEGLKVVEGARTEKCTKFEVVQRTNPKCTNEALFSHQKSVQRTHAGYEPKGPSFLKPTRDRHVVGTVAGPHAGCGAQANSSDEGCGEGGGCWRGHAGRQRRQRRGHAKR